jgi:membrane protein
VSAPPPVAKTDLIGRLSARVLELPPVRWLKPILDDYSLAGGGLLASGVAFNSLFAILPAILLLISLLGFVLQDPVRLEQIVEALATEFPPLADFFRLAFAQFSAGAVSFGLIGLVGLVWGSSRFYQSLDEAIARIFHGSRQRDPIQRGLRGVLSVMLLIGAVLAVVYVVGWLDSRRSDLPVVGQLAEVARSAVGSAIGTVFVFSVAIGFIYRMVPTQTPRWAAIWRPALAVGFALAVLTGIFALITPRLVGSLRVYGAFVAVFAAMIWLSYVAQAILVGGAWVHRRSMTDDEDELAQEQG